VQRESRWGIAGLCGLLLIGVGVLGSTAEAPDSAAEALHALRSLVAQNPTDVSALNDLGNLLALVGNLEEATQTYQRALEIEPGNTAPRYNLALVLAERGERKQALDELRTVVEIDPRHAWAHYQLGTLYGEQNRRSKAIQAYELAFSLDPSLTEPRVNPHIVENRLVTESLLRAYVARSPSTQAPRLYLDPGAVANLLLLRTPVQPEVEIEPSAKVEPHRAAFQPTDSRDDSDNGGTAERDIQGGESPSTRRFGSALGTQAAVPEGTPGSQPSQSSPPPTTDPSPAPAGSTVFVPTLSSTGKLELELLPASELLAAIAAS